MPSTRKLWQQLPKFMKTHQTVRAELQSYESYGDDKDHQVKQQWEDRPIDTANLITSRDTANWGGYHRPVIDIDFPAQLIPSSTEGHYHLFIDHLMSTEAYFKLLEALVEAGLVQQGVVNGAKRRGATSVRLPWIKKDNIIDNVFDPSSWTDDTESKIRKLKEELAELESEKKKFDSIFLATFKVSP